MFLCLAAWPASARLACTGVMLRLCRERGGGAGEEGEGGREWGVGGEMGGGEAGGGGGAGGVYFLREDCWRRV